MNRLEIVREKYLNKKEDKLEKDLQQHYDLTLLYFCHIVYYQPYDISRRLKEYGAHKVCVYNYEEMQASLAEFNNFAVVSFRGIEKWDEFKIILKFWKKDFGPIKAHAGFVDSIKKISRSLIKDLEELPRNKRLIFTGHSMGGALALLLSLHYKPTEICTYGTPKVAGGEIFRNHFKDIQVRRIKTERDFVTWLPWFLPGISDYEHIGEEKIIPGKENHPYKSHRIDCYMKALIREKRAALKEMDSIIDIDLENAVKYDNTNNNNKGDDT